MNAMRNDFLTIPEAPNYEINSQFMVRNKKTGRIKKSYYKKNTNSLIVKLWVDGRPLWRSVYYLREQAVAAVKDAKIKSDDWWITVSSLNNLYEINPRGILRNTKTKHVLKKFTVKNYACYHVTINSVRKTVNVKNLLWEVHGIIPSPSKIKPVSTTIFKNSRGLKFSSLLDTARFLHKFGDKTLTALYKKLRQRVAEIYGWHIIYHETDNLHELHKK